MTETVTGGAIPIDPLIRRCVFCIQLIDDSTPWILCDCKAEICIPCFECGSEGGKHKRGHGYRVYRPDGTMEVATERIEKNKVGPWKFTEERQLLDTIQHFKLGNWTEVVTTLNKGKKEKKTKEEYIEYFQRFFISSTIGQIAMCEKEWFDSREKFLYENQPEMLRRLPRTEPLYYQLVLEMLRSMKKLPDLEDFDELKCMELLETYVKKKSLELRKKKAIEINNRPVEDTTNYGEDCEDDWLHEINGKQKKRQTKRFKNQLDKEHFLAQCDNYKERRAAIIKRLEHKKNGTEPPVLESRRWRHSERKLERKLFEEAGFKPDFRDDELTASSIDTDEAKSESDAYDSGDQEREMSNAMKAMKEEKRMNEKMIEEMDEKLCSLFKSAPPKNETKRKGSVVVQEKDDEEKKGEEEEDGMDWNSEELGPNDRNDDGEGKVDQSMETNEVKEEQKVGEEPIERSDEPMNEEEAEFFKKWGYKKGSHLESWFRSMDHNSIPSTSTQSIDQSGEQIGGPSCYYPYQVEREGSSNGSDATIPARNGEMDMNVQDKNDDARSDDSDATIPARRERNDSGKEQEKKDDLDGLESPSSRRIKSPLYAEPYEGDEESVGEESNEKNERGDDGESSTVQRGEDDSYEQEKSKQVFTVPQTPILVVKRVHAEGRTNVTAELKPRGPKKITIAPIQRPIDDNVEMTALEERTEEDEPATNKKDRTYYTPNMFEIIRPSIHPSKERKEEINEEVELEREKNALLMAIRPLLGPIGLKPRKKAKVTRNITRISKLLTSTRKLVVTRRDVSSRSTSPTLGSGHESDSTTVPGKTPSHASRDSPEFGSCSSRRYPARGASPSSHKSPDRSTPPSRKHSGHRRSPSGGLSSAPRSGKSVGKSRKRVYNSSDEDEVERYEEEIRQREERTSMAVEEDGDIQRTRTVTERRKERIPKSKECFVDLSVPHHQKKIEAKLIKSNPNGDTIWRDKILSMKEQLNTLTDDEEISEKEDTAEPDEPVPKKKARRSRKRIATSKRERRAMYQQKKINKANREARKPKKSSTLFTGKEYKYLREAMEHVPFDELDVGLHYRPVYKGMTNEFWELGYNRERDEYEEEFFDEAEELISRIYIYNEKATPGKDIAMEVKISKVQRYLRVLQERRAIRHMMAEHERLPKFFALMKKQKKTLKKRKNLLNDGRDDEAKLRNRLETCFTRDQLLEMKLAFMRLDDVKTRHRRLRALHERGITSTRGHEQLCTERTRIRSQTKKWISSSERKQIDEFHRRIVAASQNPSERVLADISARMANLYVKSEEQLEGTQC